MARLIIVSWRDIPFQVLGKRGRQVLKLQLSERFQQAVDRAAMRAGRGQSHAYLADWRRTERECGDEVEAEAAREVERIEATYSAADLERLIRAHGNDEAASDAAAAPQGD